MTMRWADGECSCGLEIGGCLYPRCPEGDWKDCPDCMGRSNFCGTCNGSGVVRTVADVEQMQERKDGD